MTNQRPNLAFAGKTNDIITALVGCTVQWADAFERVTLKVGDHLLTAGMRPAFVYAPLYAVVSLLCSPTGERENDVTVGVLGSGDLVGVGAMLGTAPSAVTAIVDMGGVALRCPAAVARRLLAEHADSREVAMAYEGLAVAESWQWLAASIQLPVIARVAAYLLVNQETSGDSMLPVTHNLMSKRMAIRRPSITKALATMTEVGIVKQTDRGRINVTDKSRLADFVRQSWPLYGTHRQAFRDALDRS